MKRKLVLMIDEESNQGFLGDELDLIKEKFDISVLCANPLEEKWSSDIEIHYVDTSITFYRLLNVLTFAICDLVWHKEVFEICRSKRCIVSRIKQSFLFYYRSELWYRYIKRSLKHEDTIMYSYWFNFYCMAAVKYKRRFSNVKIVTRTHRYDLYQYIHEEKRLPFRKYIDNGVDRVVFISDHGREYYLNEHNKALSNKYLINYLGTNDYGYYDDYKKKDVLHIISCSHMNPVKRIELIVKGLSKIDDIKIEWVHIGGGYCHDEIKKMAESVLIGKPNISWRLVGPLNHKDVFEYYKNNMVDLFITTTQSEGQPVTIMEAMSFGIPIIATDTENIPYMIDGNGFLLPKDMTGNDVAYQIRRFNSLNEEEIMNMRHRSRMLWEQKYRGDVNSKYFVDNILGKL